MNNCDPVIEEVEEEHNSDQTPKKSFNRDKLMKYLIRDIKEGKNSRRVEVALRRQRRTRVTKENLLGKLKASVRLKCTKNLARVDETKEEYKTLPRRKKVFRIRNRFTFSDKFEDNLGRNKKYDKIFQKESEDHDGLDLWSVRPIKEVK